MTIASDLAHMKERVAQLNEQRIRAEANYDQVLSQLKELGYDSVEDAEEALQELQNSIRDNERKLADSVDALLNTYPELD